MVGCVKFVVVCGGVGVIVGGDVNFVIVLGVIFVGFNVCLVGKFLVFVGGGWGWGLFL